KLGNFLPIGARNEADGPGQVACTQEQLDAQHWNRNDPASNCHHPASAGDERLLERSHAASRLAVSSLDDVHQEPGLRLELETAEVEVGSGRERQRAPGAAECA